MMSSSDHGQGLDRRAFLAASGAAAGSVVATVLAPGAAEASPRAAALAIRKIIGTREPRTGRIDLRLPEIAENGGNVPLTVTVDSPMTPEDHVRAVHVFTEGNPNPETIDVYFTPKNGKASFSARIRLAGTQRVLAVAEMSDGTVWQAAREVKVTIGGCGG